MARKSLVAILAGVAAFAVPNAFADKGGIPHDGSNGQGRPAATQQNQTAATAPHGKALAKGHAKTHANAKAHSQAKVHGNAKSQVHGNSTAPKTQGPPATNTHAKAGKMTICHATGSATNPYVTITISNNAIPAHRRHQDGRDIIPAPEGGCPTGQQSQSQQPSTPPTETQPGAPTTQTAAPATQQTTAPGTSQVLGESTTSGSSPSSTTTGSSTPSAGRVLGATTSGSSPSASTSPAATATRAASSSSLPFTGTDAIIVAILGLAALLIGVSMRRAAAVRSGRS
jgi:hypothetical protein